MFSEALRILDRNTAELMVDRMKDEMEALKEQNDELQQKLKKADNLQDQNNELSTQNNKLQAEVERLKKLLAEQNK